MDRSAGKARLLFHRYSISYLLLKTQIVLPEKEPSDTKDRNDKIMALDNVPLIGWQICDNNTSTYLKLFQVRLLLRLKCSHQQ